MVLSIQATPVRKLSPEVVCLQDVCHHRKLLKVQMHENTIENHGSILCNPPLIYGLWFGDFWDFLKRNVQKSSKLNPKKRLFGVPPCALVPFVTRMLAMVWWKVLIYVCPLGSQKQGAQCSCLEDFDDSIRGHFKRPPQTIRGNMVKPRQSDPLSAKIRRTDPNGCFLK